ncbi:MAG: hypothetical protein IJU54_01285 [Alphaproteobacteria bacterium]|nr:hypothetical protein [Alphaproteobacteria bacterium]
MHYSKYNTIKGVDDGYYEYNIIDNTNNNININSNGEVDSKFSISRDNSKNNKDSINTNIHENTYNDNKSSKLFENNKYKIITNNQLININTDKTAVNKLTHDNSINNGIPNVKKTLANLYFDDNKYNNDDSFGSSEDEELEDTQDTNQITTDNKNNIKRDINEVYNVICGPNLCKNNSKVNKIVNDFIDNTLLNKDKTQFSKVILNYLTDVEKLKKIYTILSSNIVQEILYDIKLHHFIDPTTLLRQFQNYNLVNNANKYLIDKIIILTTFKCRYFAEFYYSICPNTDLQPQTVIDEELYQQAAIHEFIFLLSSTFFENYLKSDFNKSSLLYFSKILSSNSDWKNIIIINVISNNININDICDALCNCLRSKQNISLLDIINNTELNDFVEDIIDKLHKIQKTANN